MNNKYECPKCNNVFFSEFPVCEKCGGIIQEFSLTDFLERNTNLLTIFGVFIVIGILIFTQNFQNQNELIIESYLISFSIAVIILILIEIKLLKYMNCWTVSFKRSTKFYQNPTIAKMYGSFIEVKQLPLIIFGLFLFFFVLNSWNLLNIYMVTYGVTFYFSIFKNIIALTISFAIIQFFYWLYETHDGARRLAFWYSFAFFIIFIITLKLKLIVLDESIILFCLSISIYGMYKFLIYKPLYEKISSKLSKFL